MGNDKSWTGERLETFIYDSTTIEHLHRYALTFDIVKEKTILDIASGEGYGSNLLSNYAAKVFGVDIDEKSILAAREKYKAENLEFKIGKADAIPLDDNSIDVVISFETLEHHDKHQEMMMEIKRVLKHNGVLIMSTPDKNYYSDKRNYQNPFHVKELYPDEFEQLVNSFFKYSIFYAQSMDETSLIIPAKAVDSLKFFKGDYSHIEVKNFNPLYIITIASDVELTAYDKISCFNGENVKRRNEEELLNKIIKDVREETMNNVKKSWSFRIGNALLKPVRLFKK